jgi:hypothetical protein
MRQLAGGVPDPFSVSGFVGAMARTGDSLYVVDLHGILRVDLETNDVSVCAGDPLVYGSTDGPALDARFKFPNGLTTDGRRLYMLDGSDPFRAVTPFAGHLYVVTNTQLEALAPA